MKSVSPTFYYIFHFTCVLAFIFFLLFDKHIASLLSFNNFVVIEFIIILILPFIYLAISIQKKIPKPHLLIIILLILTFLAGVSLNQFLPSLVGVFFLFKALLIFMIAGRLSISRKMLKLILFLLFCVSVFSGVITMIQPFVEINIFDFQQMPDRYYGIMENANINATLLIFGYIIAVNGLFRNTFIKVILFIFFLTALIVCASRQGLFLFLFLILISLIINKRYVIALLLILFSSIFVILVKDTLLSRFNELDRIVSTGDYFRFKAVIITGKILTEKPFFGLGPGYFGGSVAHYFDSKYHKEYNLFHHFDTKSYKPKTVDMYWTHVLAEIGIVGIIFYIYVLKSIFKYFYRRHYDAIHFMTLMLLLLAILNGFGSMAMEASSPALISFLIAGIIYNKEYITKNNIYEKHNLV